MVEKQVENWVSELKIQRLVAPGDKIADVWQIQLQWAEGVVQMFQTWRSIFGHMIILWSKIQGLDSSCYWDSDKIAKGEEQNKDVEKQVD